MNFRNTQYTCTTCPQHERLKKTRLYSGGLFIMLPPGCCCYYYYYSSPLSIIFPIPFLSTVKPSKPRCYAEGPTQEGKDIVLRCKSNEGTNPLQYSWDKTSGGKLLPSSAVLGKLYQTSGKSVSAHRSSFFVTLYIYIYIYII